MMIREEKFNGPAICTLDGHLNVSSMINSEFKSGLTKIQEMHPHLIKSSVDVYEVYNIRHSLRRGSSSTAREEGVKPDTIDLINRWIGIERRRGGRRGQQMRDHYTEIRMMRRAILKYSAAL